MLSTIEKGVPKKNKAAKKKLTLLSPTSPTRQPLKHVLSINDVPMCQCVPMNSE